MSILTDLGNSLITAATGSTPAELQAQAAQAEQQLTIAVATMIGLEAIIAFELLVIMAIVWKERHG